MKSENILIMCHEYYYSPLPRKIIDCFEYDLLRIYFSHNSQHFIFARILTNQLSAKLNEF